MIPAGTKVYFAVQHADLRRPFEGLAATAASTMAKDPSVGSWKRLDKGRSGDLDSRRVSSAGRPRRAR
jgi:hypothetical protein